MDSGLQVDAWTLVGRRIATSATLTKNVMKWVCSFSLSISRPSAAASRIHHKSKKVDGKGKRTGDG